MQIIHVPEAENDNDIDTGLAMMAGCYRRRNDRPKLYDFPLYQLTPAIHLSFSGYGFEDHTASGLSSIWDRLAVADLTSLQKSETEFYR